MPADGKIRSIAVPRSLLASLLSSQLYPSLGIMFFAAGIAQILNALSSLYMLLIFSGSGIIYLADRLQPDKADRLNCPERSSCMEESPELQIFFMLIYGGIFLVTPLFYAQYWSYFLILPGLLIALGYSYRLPGCQKRLKDIRAVKTLFPALAITAAIFVLVIHDLQLKISLLNYFSLIIWTFLSLLSSIWLCDLRDIQGDRLQQVRTLAVLAGRKKSAYYLSGIWVCCFILAWHIAPFCILATAVQGLSLMLHKRFKSEGFYNWIADAFLFAGLFCLI